jgi:mannose-1-phosphate guanylyltransferase
MIPALVLTAGLATRLRPLSRVRAKAALPVAGQPLVHRIIRWLVSAGIQDLVLNLHHLPHTITAIVGDGTHLGARVRYSWEIPVLGSAGGPRHALPLLAAPRFAIVNGDTITNVDLKGIIDAHRDSGALVTMALVPNTEPHKYGGVLVDDGGRITGFTRKGTAQPSFHFIGVQVAESETFASLPDNTPHESVGALYPEWIRQRPGSVRGFIADAEFLDIGTPADYLDTSLRLAAREGQSLYGTSVLWDDVVVDPGARLHRCVVTDAVHVPAGEWNEVTMRRADGELEAFEERRGAIAVAPLVR